MQHLWLFTSALLVAIGVFQVEGLPAGGGGGKRSGLTIRTEESLQDFSGTILSATLGLNEGNPVSASDTLQRLILGQANGNIPFTAAYEYLNNAANYIPETARVLQAISLTISCIQDGQQQQKEVDTVKLFFSALNNVCQYSEWVAKQYWSGVPMSIVKFTIFNDEEGAKDIVDFLKEQYNDLTAFEGMVPPKEQLHLLQQCTKGTDIYYN